MCEREDYIMRLVAEIDGFLIKETVFTATEEEYSYMFEREQITGRMIINNRAVEQKRRIKIDLRYEKDYICYDITYKNEENEDNFLGVGYTLVIDPGMPEERSVVFFVKSLTDFKEFIESFFK